MDWLPIETANDDIKGENVLLLCPNTDMIFAGYISETVILQGFYNKGEWLCPLFYKPLNPTHYCLIKGEMDYLKNIPF